VKLKKSLLITDLDNTLFDWFEIWYRPFKAMFDQLTAQSGIPAEILEADFKRVHQKHGTSEYAFSIEELSSLVEKHPGEDLKELYKSAIDRYRIARREVMSLYPTVMEALNAIRSNGAVIVAYTESLAFYTSYRIKKLGLDAAIDYLYSPKDHDLPLGLRPEHIRFYTESHYTLEHALARNTPSGEIKPNPQILIEIIREVGGSIEETIYVGDSLMKDILMAKDAGVTDAYAKYGLAQNRPEYELLRRVTHWQPSAVETERMLSAKEVRPSLVLEKTFSEILDYVQFEGFQARE
jgi:phosphoglycolate phosphatase-like HAD superfamily hydrolase